MILLSPNTLVILMQWVTLSSAISYYNAFKRQSVASTAISYDGPKVPTYNISIPVDHFDDSNDATYNNRYWINDTYYQTGGPVFFLDHGEQGVTDQAAAQYLAEINMTSATMRLAKQYNGMAVLWEHRYFGRSQPVPINRSTSLPEGGTAGFQYLTVEQALEDAVYFAQNFCPENYLRQDCDLLSPSNTPWVWIGGSYPGLRAALIRIRNPETFYAAWASSAPVQARRDGSPYFTPIAASLPQNCSDDIEAVVQYADEIMSGDRGEEALSDLRRLAWLTSLTKTGFNENITIGASTGSHYTPYQISSLMTMALLSDFQSFGPPNTTDLFCNYLESFNPNGVPGNDTDPYIAILTNPGDGEISEKGIVATYNESIGLNAYLYGFRRFYSELTEKELQGEQVELPYDYFADVESWEWLVFNEFGWLQGSNTSNITIVSKFQNISAVDAFRRDYYFYDNSSVPNRPHTQSILQYGGWNMQPNNTMFTVGEFDPWRGGTVLSEETEIGAPVRKTTSKVPQCGQPPDGTDVFGAIYPGAVHVQDLILRNGTSYDGTNSYGIGYELFTQALDKWLACFNATSA